MKNVSSVATETPETVATLETPETVATRDRKPKKQTNSARQKARDYLESHPEYDSYSLRELAEITGFSKDTIARARGDLLNVDKEKE